MLLSIHHVTRKERPKTLVQKLQVQVKTIEQPYGYQCSSRSPTTVVVDHSPRSSPSSSTCSLCSLGRESVHQLRPPRRVRFNPTVSYVTHTSSAWVKDKKLAPTAEGKTLDLATVTIVDWLQHNSSKPKVHAGMTDALQTLLSSPAASQRSMEKAFEALDTSIFRKKISESAVVVFSDKTSLSAPGMTFAPHNKYAARTAIVLGRQNIMSLPANARPYIVLLTLIHQMVHAYFLAICGKQETGPYADGRLKHGHHFWSVYFAVTNIMEGYDNTSRTSLLSKSMRNIRWHGKTSCRPSKAPHSDLNTFDKTDCTLDTMPVISQDEADLWLSKVRYHATQRTSKYLNTFNLDTEVFGEVPRHEKGSLLDYYEVSWKDYTFLYGKGAIDNDFPSLAERWFSESQHILRIPNDTSCDIVKMLLCFLKRGDYKPWLRDPFSLPCENLTPIIATNDCSTSQKVPNNLLHDIKAYKLAASLGFIEMQSHIMRRLHSHSFVVSDPLPVISEVYINTSETDESSSNSSKGPGSNGSDSKTAGAWSIPEDLREWTRKFMGNSLASQKGYFSSNMVAMDYFAPKPGLHGLVVSSSSTELASDYQSVRDKLWCETPDEEKPTQGIWVEGGPCVAPLSPSYGLGEDRKPNFLWTIPPPPELPDGQQWKRWAADRYESYRKSWVEVSNAR